MDTVENAFPEKGLVLDGDTVVSPGSKDATFDAVGSIIAAIDGIENEFKAAHCVKGLQDIMQKNIRQWVFV